jgi:hypothetical protein
MKKLGSYPLLLATLLQLAPLWRSLGTSAVTTGAPAIAIIRSLLLFSGIVGSVDALSAASAVSIPKQTFNAKVGVKASFPIVIQFDPSYTINIITWDPVSPGILPPGLSLTTSPISFDPLILSATIKGTPTTAGTYMLTITAKENDTAPANRTVTGTITVIVAPADAPPQITTAPSDQSVTEGGTATFSVIATSAAPVRYQWYFNTNQAIARATNASLVLNPVQLTAAGTYSVWVTNKFGGLFSPVARLTVNPKVVVPPFSLGNPQTVGSDFHFALPIVAGANYAVQYLSALKGATWQTVSNLPTPSVSGTADIHVPISGPQGWFRVTSTP